MRRTVSFKNSVPFEAAVAEAIESFGYKADTQVGSAGFKIDLAVRDPSKSGRYMLAIECDGATYHAALWARERDRLRQQILEGLGWRFHRIWSTDWFYRRARELEKLKQVLDARRAQKKARLCLRSSRPPRQRRAACNGGPQSFRSKELIANQNAWTTSINAAAPHP